MIFANEPFAEMLLLKDETIFQRWNEDGIVGFLGELENERCFGKKYAERQRIGDQAELFAEIFSWKVLPIFRTEIENE